jgi:hypothetical protein
MLAHSGEFLASKITNFRKKIHYNQNTTLPPYVIFPSETLEKGR